MYSLRENNYSDYLLQRNFPCSVICLVLHNIESFQGRNIIRKTSTRKEFKISPHVELLVALKCIQEYMNMKESYVLCHENLKSF